MTAPLPLRRGVALSLVAQLLFATAGPAYGGHGCPHHDLPDLPDRAAPVAQDPAHTHAHTHAQDPAQDPAPPHANQHAGPAEPASHHDAGHEGACTCIGTCHVGSAAPLPGEAPRIESAAAIQAARPAVEARSSVARTPRYLLPFANAPPPSR